MRGTVVTLALLVAAVCCHAGAAGPSSSSSSSSSSPPAPLLSIDFGSEWSKVALAHHTASAIGAHLDVVINEQSNRKSQSLLAFDSDDDRVVGDAAATLLVRTPAKAFPHVKRLLGQPFDSPAVAAFQRDFPSLTLQADPERGTVLFHRGSGHPALSVEEVAVMLLQQARDQAAAHLRANSDGVVSAEPTEVVLTVPEHWTSGQRALYAQLAEMAGLRVKDTVNELTAVAVDYAVRNQPKPAAPPTRVIFFGAGAVGTSASLVELSRAAEGAPITLTVLRTASDPLVGGYAFDLALRDALADRFDKQAKAATAPIRSNARSMSKLLREAREVKEMLSVSPAIEVAMEELHAGQDFKAAVTLEEYQQWTAPLVERMVQPLRDLLSAEGAAAASVTGVELFGGAVRAPAVQAALRAAAPSLPLGKHVDGEEACLLGAAHLAGAAAGVEKLQRVQVQEEAAVRQADEREPQASTQQRTLTPAQQAALASRLASLAHAAEQRRLRDAARNALESALNEARELVAAAGKKAKEAKEKAEELIAAASAWLDDDAGRDTEASEFDARRSTLLAAVQSLRAPKKVEKEAPSKPRKKRDRRAEHKRAMEELAKREAAEKKKKERAEKERAERERKEKQKKEQAKKKDAQLAGGSQKRQKRQPKEDL